MPYAPSQLCHTTQSQRHWVNSNLGEAGWTDAGMDAGLAALRPAVLRYPGGTVANYWDWRTGQVGASGAGAGVPFIAALARGGPPRAANTPATFMAACDPIGAQGVWVLNLLVGDRDDQIALLLAAQAAGAQVGAVELGNELYSTLPEVRARFPTPEAYVAEAGAWAAALRKVFPGVRCAAVALGRQPAEDDAERLHGWDAGLARALGAHPAMDALVVHVYAASPVDELARRLATTRGLVLPAKRRELRRDPVWAELRREARLGPGLAAAAVAVGRARIARLLGEGTADLPDLPLWVTEYNLLETGDNGLGGSWGQALAVATMTLDLAAAPRIAMALAHNLVGNAGFALLMPGNDRVLQFTPTGGLLAVLGPLLVEGTRIESLEPAQPSSGLTDLTETLVVWRITGPDGGIRVVAVNPTDTPARLADTRLVAGLVGRVWSAQTLDRQPPVPVAVETTLPPRCLALWEGAR